MSMGPQTSGASGVRAATARRQGGRRCCQRAYPEDNDDPAHRHQVLLRGRGSASRRQCGEDSLRPTGYRPIGVRLASSWCVVALNLDMSP